MDENKSAGETVVLSNYHLKFSNKHNNQQESMSTSKINSQNQFSFNSHNESNSNQNQNSNCDTGQNLNAKKPKLNTSWKMKKYIL